MTVESIIGIVGGIISIAGGIIWLANRPLIKEKLKAPMPKELFEQLCNKALSDAERKKILEKLNRSSLINMRIKEEYIQNFTLGKRGKEVVLLDICDSNNIEPTDDICKGLIGVSMPSIRKSYNEKRRA